jgi:hypothetical protein
VWILMPGRASLILALAFVLGMRAGARRYRSWPAVGPRAVLPDLGEP